MIDNFMRRDPTHVLQAKYFLEKHVMASVDGKTYTWPKGELFYCKPVKPKYKHWTNDQNGGKQGDKPDAVYLETKWAGLPYEVGDYVEYRGLKYIIESVEKDETRDSIRTLQLFNSNPNTYYTLSLIQVQEI